MTITAGVQRQFFGDDLPTPAKCASPKQVIRLPLVSSSSSAASTRTTPRPPVSQTPKGSLWTEEEHERFLTGLEMYPRGPWKRIAQLVATRTTRQTMTHAQKYRERIARHVKQYGAIATPFAPAPATRQRPTALSEDQHPPVAGIVEKSRAQSRVRKKRQPARPEGINTTRVHPISPPPPELAAIEWLLAVHPFDFENDGPEKSFFATRGAA